MPKTQPNKIDPTRTITLRRSFKTEINRAFNELKKEILKLIVDEDALGLKPDRSILYNQTYDYCSTQIDITDAKVLEYVRQLQSILLPEDIVKLDTETHITVRYGLYDGPTTLDGVKALVSEYGEIEAKIVGLSIFEIADSDVLKYDVESWQLKELNDRLKLLPNKQTYDYHPHMTIAYLKKGTAQAYVGKTAIDGMIVKSDSLTYSNPFGEKVSISLSQRMTGNKRWKYKNQDDAVKEFEKWIDGKVDSVLLSQAQANKWRKYIDRGFEKGAARAFDDTSKSRKEDPKLLQRSAGFVEGRREQFIRQTMGQSIAAEKLKLLESRALADVQGMTADLKNKSRRILTDGLVGNLSPREIASNLMKQLDLSKQRALAIAYTELVRAHAEGQLESMRTLGVEKVGVAIEWSTAKGACKLCEPLKGIVLTLGEARGMIPRHVNCRCAWVPANVGESKEEKKGQLRSKTKIDKAIRASERQDTSDSDWGPAKDIAKDRPKSVLNVEDCNCEHLNAFALLLDTVTNAKGKTKLSGGNWVTIKGQHIYMKDGVPIAGGSPALRKEISEGKYDKEHKVPLSSSSTQHEKSSINYGKNNEHESNVSSILGSKDHSNFHDLLGALPGSKITITKSTTNSFEAVVDHDDYHLATIISKNNMFIRLMKSTHPGSGIGLLVLKSQVDAASEHGMQRIDLEAVRKEGMNGYYTWPRLGFNSHIDDFLADFPSNKRKDFDIKLKELVPHKKIEDIQMSDIMKTEEGRQWWKEKGFTIGASFDLKEGSVSKTVLDAYIKEIKDKKLVINKANESTVSVAEPPTVDDKILDKIWDKLEKLLKEKQ